MDEMVRPHICLIYGTRPEAIKLAPVYRELKQRAGVFDTTVVVTAQHRQLLDQMLTVFGIKPDVDLDIMREGQTLSQVTCRALEALQTTLHRLAPDMVLVQGDTTTVFTGALAAFYEQIAVGHVEAGLRSENKYSPFPEEINRRMTGVLADLHFAPTPGARERLLAENTPGEQVFVTGNTVIDALQMMNAGCAPMPDATARLVEQVSGRMILVTVHRRENLGVAFTQICTALQRIVHDFPDVSVIWPMHPNPIVRRAAEEMLGDHPQILLCEPLDYFGFVPLMAAADLIITDSGGIQEEASALGTPVLVTRDTTERPEGIAAGVARLVGVETDTIVTAATELLTNPSAYARMSEPTSPYGDGQAARRICDVLEFHFGLSERRPEDFSTTDRDDATIAGRPQ